MIANVVMEFDDEDTSKLPERNGMIIYLIQLTLQHEVVRYGTISGPGRSAQRAAEEGEMLCGS